METMKERFSIKTWKEEVINKTPEKKSFDTPDIKEMILKSLRKFKYNDISFGAPVIKKRHVFIELTLSGKTAGGKGIYKANGMNSWKYKLETGGKKRANSVGNFAV